MKRTLLIALVGALVACQPARPHQYELTCAQVRCWRDLGVTYIEVPYSVPESWLDALVERCGCGVET